MVSLTDAGARAQTSGPASGIQLVAAPQDLQSTSAAGTQQTIAFSDALQRARTNNPQMQAAYTALGLAHQDFVQSRAALLPNVSYNMQAIYTEPASHGSSNQVFIANNGFKSCPFSP